MRNNEYFLENTKFINENDLKNFRVFYTPFLGANAVILYQYFIDLWNIYRSNVKTFNFNEINVMLKLDTQQLLDAKAKLEAIGLIKTYESSFYKKTIFKLQKPLNAKMIAENKLFLAKLAEFLPIEKIEQLIEENCWYEIDKDEYIETTAKFIDVFNVNIKNIFANKSISNEEKSLISKMKSTNLIELHYQKITGRKIAPSIKKRIEKILEQGFSQEAVKHFLDFCSKVNGGDININYIDKIAKSYLEKDIIKADDVLAELNESWNQKNKSKTNLNKTLFDDDEIIEIFKNEVPNYQLKISSDANEYEDIKENDFSSDFVLNLMK
ncbi:DnaD domain protein [Mycoplasma iguanae]|uniref:DnaD domain protein n=1 Tax=Mycoplasma iguanae TaxID=292461 RepID=A0ABY5RB08_9MOLU|nr:DnaD domain protein [Mycoplasma iguanae]UVD81937.1 DnaD domain protein [Mycoplasma iguanae]